MNYYLIFLIILIIWFGFLYAINSYLKNNKNFSLYGPALLFKTERGKKFIERISRNRIWKRYGDFGIILSFVIMFGTLALLIWEATLVPLIPKSSAPSPIEALGLPGINPLIPIWYGLLAIIIAVVIHEFSHGILTNTQKMKINSLGILFFIIPVGAFVEPDEEELSKAPRLKRMRVYAAGATTNIVVATIAALLFLSLFSGVTPIAHGAVITSVYSDPFNNLNTGMEITNFNGTSINSTTQFNSVMISPGAKVNATVFYNNNFHNLKLYAGVMIVNVVAGTPAADSELKAGEIIKNINNVTIYNSQILANFLDSSLSGEMINISLLQYSSTGIMQISKSVTLMDKYAYYSQNDPAANNNSYKGHGFLGISSSYLGVAMMNVSLIPAIMSNPVGPITIQNLFHGFLLFISLPFLGLAPLSGSLASLYTTPFYAPLFWIIVNIIYWIFWLDLMLGMTNLLPAIPLDGGYLFRDAFSGFLHRLNLKIKNFDRAANIITGTLSVLILFLILWEFIGPRIL